MLLFEVTGWFWSGAPPPTGRGSSDKKATEIFGRTILKIEIGIFRMIKRIPDFTFNEFQIFMYHSKILSSVRNPFITIPPQSHSHNSMMHPIFGGGINNPDDIESCLDPPPFRRPGPLIMIGYIWKNKPSVKSFYTMTDLRPVPEHNATQIGPKGKGRSMRRPR